MKFYLKITIKYLIDIKIGHKNLIKIIIPYLILVLGFIIAIIVLITLRKKRFFLISLVLLILIGSTIPGSIPYFKDIKKPEIITEEGTYTNYMRQGPHTFIFSSENEFQDKHGNTFYVLVPNLEYSKLNLHTGNVYRVEYYKNTHVAKSITLIT